MERNRALDPAGWLDAHAKAHNWPSRADASLSFEHPQLRKLRALWWEVAGVGRLPSRAQFTARLLKPFLADLTIVGIVGPPDTPRRYIHRFVGSHIVSVMGELTGLAFEDFLPPTLVPRTLAFMDAVADSRRPLRIFTQFSFEKADYLSAEIFAAPLSDDGIRPNALMSVAYFASAAAQEARQSASG